jgi:hypothetical protein
MMCNFFSAIVLKNGDVLHLEGVDSHADLVRHFKLPDDTECRHFAKVELTPGADPFDASTYVFRLDEATAPGWWEDVAGAAERQCRGVVHRLVAWETCSRPRMMLDAVAKSGARVKDIRLCASQFARLSLENTGVPDAEVCIATVEAYCLGLDAVTIDDVREARHAAAAAYAAYAAAAYAAYAADAATAAVGALCAAADAAAYAAARQRTQRECCDIIRRFWGVKP